MTKQDYDALLARSRFEWETACRHCTLPQCIDTSAECRLKPSNGRKASGAGKGSNPRSHGNNVHRRKRLAS